MSHRLTHGAIAGAWLTCLAAVPSWAEPTPASLAATHFPGATLSELSRPVSADERAALHERDVRIPRGPRSWHAALQDNALVGYVCSWQARGKHGNIDVLVAATPTFEVAGVAVAKHRERRGRGIVRASFLKQFLGKSSSDAWELGDDLDAITSATIASSAVLTCVRDSLCFLEVLYAK